MYLEKSVPPLITNTHLAVALPFSAHCLTGYVDVTFNRQAVLYPESLSAVGCDMFTICSIQCTPNANRAAPKKNANPNACRAWSGGDQSLPRERARRARA